MSEKHYQHLDELAKLIGEYRLSEATLEVDGFKVSLKKAAPKVVAVAAAEGVTVASEPEESYAEEPAAAPVVNHGTPISSPMMGIFYSSSSPSSPPYVKEGDTVTAGQVIGLIEAMKVFNEIHATVSGVVKKVAVESGAVVNPGDPLVFIG